MWPIFPTNPNDPNNSNRQILPVLQNTRTLLNAHPHHLQCELDRSKHFLYLAADKVRTKDIFDTIQMNLDCIIQHRSHFQTLIINSTEAIQNRTFPPGKGRGYYLLKISKLKVIILILTAEISARTKILQNPRALDSYDWSYMRSGRQADCWRI